MQVPPPPYIALSPTGNAEQVEEYCNALSWAISNRKEKDIKNIALTGPYGSGKSSILKTFMSSNKDKSLHFLPISLATFKEEVYRPLNFWTKRVKNLRQFRFFLLLFELKYFG